jgi:hypothetical protein
MSILMKTLNSYLIILIIKKNYKNHNTNSYWFKVQIFDQNYIFRSENSFLL